MGFPPTVTPYGVRHTLPFTCNSVAVLCRWQIEERIRDVLELRGRLRALWQRKKEHLEDLYNQQMFLRDVNQLETLSNTQQVLLFSLTA